MIKDNDDGHAFTIPAGHDARGRRLLRRRRRQRAGGFGLGSGDSARLFAPADLVTPIDSYSWTSHAAATYGRCPDGTGPMGSTSSSTRGAANACPVAGARPGRAATRSRPPTTSNVFGGNLSGLAYQPSGSAAPGVLWAVRNGPSTLYRLIHDGTKWTPDTANGWATGKQLLFPNGAGVPDAEGVTLAGGDAERDLRLRRAQRQRRPAPTPAAPRSCATTSSSAGAHPDRDQGVRPDRGPARPGRERGPRGRHLDAGRRARRQGLLRRDRGARTTRPPTPTTARACSSSASSRTARSSPTPSTRRRAPSRASRRSPAASRR